MCSTVVILPLLNRFVQVPGNKSLGNFSSSNSFLKKYAEIRNKKTFKQHFEGRLPISVDIQSFLQNFTSPNRTFPSSNSSLSGSVMEIPEIPEPSKSRVLKKKLNKNYAKD